jgi:hypothetical protein
MPLIYICMNIPLEKGSLLHCSATQTGDLVPVSGGEAPIVNDNHDELMSVLSQMSGKCLHIV